MRRLVRKRDLLARIESIEERLALPVPEPIPGQQTISVATIGHHTYEGPGACRADLFGTVCGAHRDEHQLVDEDDLP